MNCIIVLFCYLLKFLSSTKICGIIILMHPKYKKVIKTAANNKLEIVGESQYLNDNIAPDPTRPAITRILNESLR